MLLLPGHIESIKEVLDGHVSLVVQGVGFFKLQNTLKNNINIKFDFGPIDNTYN